LTNIESLQVLDDNVRIVPAKKILSRRVYGIPSKRDEYLRDHSKNPCAIRKIFWTKRAATLRMAKKRFLRKFVESRYNESLKAKVGGFFLLRYSLR